MLFETIETRSVIEKYLSLPSLTRRVIKQGQLTPAALDFGCSPAIPLLSSTEYCRNVLTVFFVPLVGP